MKLKDIAVGKYQDDLRDIQDALDKAAEEDGITLKPFNFDESVYITELLKVLQHRIVDGVVEFSLCDPNEIIKLMELCGYNPEKDGICAGITMMAIMSFLSSGKFDEFNERLHFLFHHQQDFVKKWEALKKDGTQFFDQKIVDTLAFFDGLQIFQLPDEHLELFEATDKLSKHKFDACVYQDNVELNAQLAYSVNFDKEKFKLSRVENWMCVYLLHEFLLYFYKLDEVIRKCHEPVCLTFSGRSGNNGHRMGLAFDPAAANWVLIDSAHLPAQPLQNISLEAIVYILYAIFSGKNGVIALKTSVFTRSDKQETVAAAIETLKSSASFKLSHQLTKRKAHYASANGYSLATLAAEYNNTVCIQTLAALGSSLFLDPALLFSAATNGNLEMLKIFLGQSSNKKSLVNQFYKGQTQLIVASHNGHTDVVEFLIEQGAEIASKTEFNRSTALLFAAQNGHFDIVKLLIDNDNNKNVNINYQEDLKGSFALLVATQNGHFQVVEWLIKQGADINLMTHNGVTALWSAIYNKKWDIAKLLLKHSAHVNVSHHPAPLLFICAQEGNIELLDLLLKHGALPSTPFINSEAGLRCFANQRHVKNEMDIFIRYKKARGESSDAISLTPYEIAIIMGRKAIANRLTPYSKQISLAKSMTSFSLFTRNEVQRNSFEILNTTKKNYSI